MIKFISHIGILKRNMFFLRQQTQQTRNAHNHEALLSRSHTRYTRPLCVLRTLSLSHRVVALSPIHRRRASRAQILLPRWDKQTVSGERVDADWWGDDWFVWSDDWCSDGEEERAMTPTVFLDCVSSCCSRA